MRRSRTLVLGATVLALALFAGACASGGDDDGGQPSDGGTSSAPAERGALTVGVSGAFAESQLVAEMYAQLLENAGYTVDRQLDLGTRQLSDKALFSGEIDMKPEYLGFELPELDPEADTTGNAEEIAALLAPLLEAKGVKLLEHSPANSTNAFVVTHETADSLGVSTMSDLAPIAGDLTLGGPPECPENAAVHPRPEGGVRDRVRRLQAAGLRRRPDGRGDRRRRRGRGPALQPRSHDRGQGLGGPRRRPGAAGGRQLRRR